MNFPLMTVLALTLVNPGKENPAEAVSRDWAARNLAYFQNIQFDFDRRFASRLLGTELLENCSNATTLCLRTPTFELNLPRSCDFGPDGKRGWPETLVQIGTTTHQVAHHDSAEYWIVMDRRYPFIVYEYSPITGIKAIAYDSGARNGGAQMIDIVDAVKSGRYERLRNNGLAYSQLLTRDPFGACKNG